MGYNVLPEPGSEHGPCQDGCEHRDCAWTRKAAESICRFCDKPIGYDRGFYSVPPIPADVKNKKSIIMGQAEETFVHSSCQQDAVQKGQ